MKKGFFSKISTMLLVLVMLAASIPVNAFAVTIDYVTGEDDYYKVITKDDYELAPGIVESEIVLNNAAGTHRQVAHVVEVDLNNEYTKVVPSYKGMTPVAGDYGVQIMSQQAAYAEANGYGNVVAAMNLSLSWYDSDYYKANPQLVGEPLGYMILDGVQYTNSQGQTSGAQTCAVINFDEKDGETRPADMPKVEIRSTSSAITGWEEQVIPANFGFLVKDGVNQYKTDNNAANGASRSFVGIKEDGTFVMVMNDGRQSPYSAGFTNYEMAEFMLSLGCVQAVNGDGGGSSTFLSQRPGEELKLNCYPSDGAERPTTHGILVISTAPATGEFVRATISTENDYYTPKSTVKFSALGTDLVGTAADIPDSVTWQLTDSSMGSIENGIFISNGKTGTVTAQMVYNDEIVGEHSIEIVIPTGFSFAQNVMTVPFGKEVNIGLVATVNEGLHNVVLKPEDVTFSTTNSALGSFNGFQFTSVKEEDASENLKSTLTATFVHDTKLVATAALNLGKGSEVLFDFEDEDDIDEWNIADVNGNDEGFYQNLSYATSSDGQVHDGIGSMRVEMNPISATGIPSGGYGQSDLFLDKGVVVENAKSIGFWAYIPDEYEHCWIRVLYWYDSNNDGVYDKKNTVTVINQPEIYNTWDESGWKYFSVDVSAYSKILIPGLDCKERIAYTAGKCDANNFRFIEFMFPHTNTNDLWKTYGTINGLQTVYVDNITADFSDAVDDRDAPIFNSVSLAGNDEGIALKKYNTVKTANNVLTITATVTENTTKTNATGLNVNSAKAYIDGVPVDVTYSNGRMTISDIAVADGIHRVKFEICDNSGNKSVVVRLVEVDFDKDTSTIQIVPTESTSDKLYGGSVYWMNVNANKIETIESVEAVIDLNYGNHWELDHMELAEGFTSSYSIDEENNTATIVITRTGDNAQTGAATLASLPIRVIYYDTDININGYTAETYWKTYAFWPYDVKVDVDKGVIKYVSGYTSDVLNSFSNEEFSVDTEMYTSSANMDSAFKTERGTAHVHSVVELEDSEVSCTEAGISGRTFCEVCNSVVAWGTTISATGHSYELVDGVLKCTCGELFNGEKDGISYADGVLLNGWSGDYYYRDGVKLTGAHEIDGVYYNFKEDGLLEGKITGLFFDEDAKVYRYAISGIAKSGWYMIGDDWHYFRTGTLAAATGVRYYYPEFPYEYDETGRLLHVVWQKYGDSYRCYYGPTFYSGTAMGTWVTIEDKQYCFVPGGLVLTGYQVLRPSFNAPYSLHQFDSKGVYIGEVKDYNGFVNGFDGIRYFLDGEMQKGLHIIDGSYYYFSTSTGAARTGEYTVTVANSNGLLTKNTTFNFDTTTGAAKEKPLNGFVTENGNTFYYINNIAQKGLQFINDSYYYFSTNTGIMRTGKYTVTVANSNGMLTKNTTFNFDTTTGAAVEKPLNGFVTQNGNTFYYINNIEQKGLQLIDGNYYYFSTNTGIMRTGKYTVTVANSNGMLTKNTTFNFDTTTGAAVEKPLNGFVTQNGNTYYYINNIEQKGLQLIDGKYYYFSTNTGIMRTGKYTVTVANSNGMLTKNTTFNFDTTTGASDGFVKVSGETYYYINNVMQKGLQLIDGKYYYFSTNTGIMRTGKYTVTVANSNGMLTKNTTFYFDLEKGFAVSEDKTAVEIY